MSKPLLKKKRKASIKLWRNWHISLGLFSAVFVVFLSLTGIALNHTDTLGLAKKHISNSWMLNHYGIHPPKNIRYFPLITQEKDHNSVDVSDVIVTDSYVWMRDKLLYESESLIVAVTVFSQFIVVAETNKLTLFNFEGEIIDQLDSSVGLPKSIINIAVAHELFYIQTNTSIFEADADLFTWTELTSPKELFWVNSREKSAKDIAIATTQYRAQFLTWERVFVDAHAGRIMGAFGVFLMDAVAVFLILLSVSGCYMWLKNRKRKVH